MTLIVVFPTTDGIVIGSDTQLTRGETRCQDFKINTFNQSCIWAYAGDVHIAQRFKIELEKIKKRNTLERNRDDIGKKIVDVVETIFEVDIRSRYGFDFDLLLEKHKIQIIFAEYKDHPVIFRYLNTGTSEHIDRPYAIGYGDVFAFALLQKYEDVYRRFNNEKALILVYKILFEAIKVGAYSVDFPIDLWAIDRHGARKIEGVEMDKINKQSIKLKEDEIKLLIR